ncbi:N-acetylmuramic acid 6-phosphate etherase [Devosia subaequoris]|uniref:N-acetylmuramic acid 6-phosphate etherase n=1 Tax=Devosia subaequoris TaxID=395930 RepID=A0A7W6NAE6_9HYPH|nr:N-acetylmuramic acid 6-phosphate etherase [Devosia subaequoris]MBB4050848.1 N-acetylmuramic acid 6-phosphate etherase [Devosia subaequoris]MCP1208475.1 N-acetylmuramic acid 6-phosphate etherase [Devosia subaequoris]
MTDRQTEARHAQAIGLELKSDAEILSLLATGQAEAAQCVVSAIPEIVRGANLAADALGKGGRLVYAAAGSSGLMALADALELPGTYGIAFDRIVVLLAGGMDALREMRGGPEDDATAAREAAEALALNENDCLIAVTASGQTLYPLAAIQVARAAGASTIGIANNAGARLFDLVDAAICLPTPAEVIAGSTRMGAGTAQKIALNMLSTLMAIRLGHVHDGYMVNVIADNEKLRGRACGIVAAIAGVDEAKAQSALAASAGAVKPAILIASGTSDLAEAEALLARHHGQLRPILTEMGGRY